ncbi:MAG: BMP family ABC transporter substrate-binding protein [Spirochaetales bacterium]|jgi:basic membrane protein A|nr:BMP family ABC transporter substrate-binding protein [Spirochaetales bacterium]
MKKVLLVVLMVCLVAGIAFARPGREGASTGGAVMAMATDVGGLGDKSFNDGAYQGLLLARDRLGAQVVVVESKQQTDYIPNLTGLAEDGARLVVAVGFLMEEAVKETATHNPDTYFAGIDIGTNPGDPSNFQGVLFNEHECGYLAGVLAGLLTQQYASAIPGKLNSQNTIGVVLGMLVPAVERYEVGFIAGARSVNPTVNVISVTTDSFTDQARGKEAALAMIDQGADIVFHAAGQTGLGSINACDERGVLAIGVDIDQNAVAPNTVVTSAMKDIVQATYLVAESVANGTFAGGTQVYGIDRDAVGLAPFHGFDSQIPQAVKDRIAAAIADMKAGRIRIPTSRAEINR